MLSLLDCESDRVRSRITVIDGRHKISQSGAEVSAPCAMVDHGECAHADLSPPHKVDVLDKDKVADYNHTLLAF